MKGVLLDALNIRLRIPVGDEVISRMMAKGPLIETRLSLKRCSPSKSWEPSVVTICRHPLASRLDGKSSKPSVLDEITPGPRLATEVNENVPVALARVNDCAGIRR